MRSTAKLGTRTTRMGVAVGAALVLASCGSSIHPGAAVVMSGETISMSQLDDLAESYCALTAVVGQQQGDSAPVAGGEARRQAAQAEIVNIAAQQVADDNGVEVSGGDYLLSPEQRAQIADVFDDSQLDGVEEVLELSQHNNALLDAIGAADLGQDADQDSARAAGQKKVQAQIADDEPEIDPRIGLGATDASAATTGSLSVGASDLSQAEAADLVPAQRCS